MEGIITIHDTRDNLDKMKKWRKEEALKIRDDINKENVIDKIIDVSKIVVKAVGTVTSIVLSICPVDGPVGEIAVTVATPLIVEAIESGRNLLKGLIVTHDNKEICATMSDMQKRVKDISVLDKNIIMQQGVSAVELNNSNEFKSYSTNSYESKEYNSFESK